ncbi:MAG: MBL fold metallo-hydrolase RNA specificity domain-containing protein [Ginsengibacter sp.]
MTLSFHGAARTVTGSKHLLSLKNGKNILLDCGMFQGMGADTDSLNSEFGFEPSSIDFVLLSHAHIDHSGLLPKLVKEGFKGKIYCTQATAELGEILLHDSAEIQTYETQYINQKRADHNLTSYEPLYSHEDVMNAVKQFEIVEYDKLFKPAKDLSIIYINNGHLIGSAAISISVTEDKKQTSILFSGDVGRTRSTLLQSPSETPQADYIIIESTYGDKHHDVSFNNIENMLEWIKKTCIKKQGKLIIAAFSVGRTQEILYILNQLELENKLPDLNIYVDSPLSLKATEAIKKYPQLFNERLQEILKIDDDPFLFKGLKYVEQSEDSRRLKESTDPCVIISASGTADAGRIRHHISQCIGDPKNTILMSGYCSVHSLGGQLLRGAKEIELFNQTIPVAAEIDAITGLSAHADSDDLLQFLNCQDPEKVKAIFLVHGEYDTQQAFKIRLENKGFKNIFIPSKGEKVELKNLEPEMSI